MTKHSKQYRIGAQRWRLEHISYKAWCKKARECGWNGEDDSDLRSYCEPGKAAAIIYFPALDLAVAAAKGIFERNPDDSAFGAILIEHQILVEAHDDSGNVLRDCRPQWDDEKVYEVTSDGDVLESAP